MVWLVFVGLAVLAVGLGAYPLLKKSGAAPRANAKAAPWTMKRAGVFAAVALAAVLLIGISVIYSPFGSPRQVPEAGDSAASEAAASAEQLEKEMEGSPTQAGYKRLANVYFAAGQYDKAVAADHRAIELGADDPVTWSELGESIVMASNGQVEPQALSAFTNAISRDPSDARARYYIGMAEAQIGNMRQAVAIWRDLEKNSDPDAPWLPMVRQHVDAFSKKGGFDPKSVPPAAPSVTALRAAIAAMSGAANRPPSSGGPEGAR